LFSNIYDLGLCGGHEFLLWNRLYLDKFVCILRIKLNISAKMIFIIIKVSPDKNR